MSEVEPVSTSAMYLDQIARLEAENARLVAQAARQSRQVAEQSMYIGSLTTENSRLKTALAEAKKTQPRRCNSRRGFARLGDA